MRRRGESFSRRTEFPHLAGLSISLSCCLIIILLIWLSDSMQRPHALNIWLDNWAWLWSTCVLLMWPAAVYAWKRYERRGRPVSSGEA
jgi:hypothetical protein